MSVLITAQLWYTIQHGTFLIIFPLIFQSEGKLATCLDVQ